MHPILFEIRGFPIGTYALFALLGLAAGLLVFGWLASRDGRSRVDFIEAGLWAFIIGLFASKLYGAAVGFDPDDPKRSLMAVLRYGGHYYVGFVAAVVFLALAFRRLRVPIPVALDYLAPALALAHGIGRVGCLMAGCCWGEACDRPWAITFTDPRAHQLTGVPLGVPLHPTQVYEAGAELILALLLLAKFLRWRWHAGSTFLCYVALYGAIRFGLELLRADPRGTLLGWPTSQPIALVSSIAALALLGWLAARRSVAESPPAAPPAASAGDATQARRGRRKKRR